MALKPEEITSILEKELDSFETSVEMEDVGVVLRDGPDAPPERSQHGVRTRGAALRIDALQPLR